MLSKMILSAPPSQPDYVGMTKDVRETIFEIPYMDWEIMGFDKIIQALQGRSFPVDHVQVGWTLHGPTVHLCPGWNDEIEISLVPIQRLVSEEGTRYAELGFCVRSDSSDRLENHITLEELVAWNGPSEGGSRGMTGIVGKCRM